MELCFLIKPSISVTEQDFILLDRPYSITLINRSYPTRIKTLSNKDVFLMTNRTEPFS